MEQLDPSKIILSVTGLVGAVGLFLQQRADRRQRVAESGARDRELKDCQEERARLRDTLYRRELDG